MNVFRLVNFHYLRRNITPDYVFCASVYRCERNIFSKVRFLSQQNKELHLLNKKSEDRNVHTAISEEKKKALQVRMLHFTPKHHVSVTEIMGQVVSLFKSIKMKDLKDAPQPVFWISTASLIPLLTPPLTFLIFGYSRFLSSAELYYAAVLCSFFGGTTFGRILSDKDCPPTWETCGWAVVPQLFGWMTLMLPNSVGYLVVLSGLALSAYMDLTMMNFPGWYNALRLAVTLFALLGLTVSFVITIFH